MWPELGRLLGQLLPPMPLFPADHITRAPFWSMMGVVRPSDSLEKDCAEKAKQF